MKVLIKGSKGGDVKVLQKYLGITPDGDFGNGTLQKVKEFQKSKGLLDDGIVGNKTWYKIIEQDLKEHNYITDADLILAAIELNVDLAVIKAIKEVESGGVGIQNGIPTMLFEGHIFWQRLKARKIDPNKFVRGNENILYPKWTKSHYSKNNNGEYERLKKAIAINEAAAYESASYGLFQIMGVNYRMCGFNSAKEMYIAMSQNTDNHLDAFMKFINAKGIIPYLRTKNWKKIAYLYNGAAYAQNNYNVKLEIAYNKYK